MGRAWGAGGEGGEEEEEEEEGAKRAMARRRGVMRRWSLGGVGDEGGAVCSGWRRCAMDACGFSGEASGASCLASMRGSALLLLAEDAPSASALQPSPSSTLRFLSFFSACGSHTNPTSSSLLTLSSLIFPFLLACLCVFTHHPNSPSLNGTRQLPPCPSRHATSSPNRTSHSTPAVSHTNPAFSSLSALSPASFPRFFSCRCFATHIPNSPAPVGTAAPFLAPSPIHATSSPNRFSHASSTARHTNPIASSAANLPSASRPERRSSRWRATQRPSAPPEDFGTEREPAWASA
mmetsp:Transcript_3439/g.8869  ORF Transcript_3439/g.8869 Transcript_3439/m.8869 type:complete len:293 (+) Transcript_3439:425-1303(+)